MPQPLERFLIRKTRLAQKKLNYSPIIEFVCEVVVQSEAEAKITRACIEALPKRWSDRAKFRANSAAFLALDVLLRRPILTTTILMEELKTSRQVVTVAVNQLVERQIIRRRGNVGRTQIYSAEELIALLSRKFGADAELALEAGRQAIARQET